METDHHTAALVAATDAAASRLFVHGFDDGYEARIPRSTHPAYLEGWADGHDLFIDDKVEAGLT